MEQKTKKGLIIGGSVFVVIALTGGITAGVLLSSKKYIGGVHRITFFSNMPDYHDKGFNELAYNAASNYADYLNNDRGIKEKVGIQSTKQYSETGYDYIPEIDQIYKKGADIIISAGFQAAAAYTGGDITDGNGLVIGHQDGLFSQDKYPWLNDGKKIVLLDDSSLASQYENAISVEFAAEDAGFMAGIAASIYSSYKAKDGGNNNVVVWGGNPFSTVYNYLSGFEQGVNWFNYQILGFDLSDHLIGDSSKVDTINDLTDNTKSLELNKKYTNLEKVKMQNGKDYSPIYSNSILPDNSSSPIGVASTWYTGGFNSIGNDADDAKIRTQWSNENANVVFPVAGANTQVALDNMGDNGNLKLIGVDSDASISFGTDSKKIIGSATKNLDLAGQIGLFAADEQTRLSAPLDDKYQSQFTNWDITSTSGSKGTLLEGTRDNNGVGYTEGKIVNYSWTEAINWLNNETSSTLDGIFEKAFELNSKIENASNTFDPHGSYDILEPITNNTIGNWIPDWTKYK